MNAERCDSSVQRVALFIEIRLNFKRFHKKERLVEGKHYDQRNPTREKVCLMSKELFATDKEELVLQ